MSQTFPATISRDDWFPCEPNEDGGLNLQEGRQYLAASRYRDRITLESYVTYTVVTPSYDDDGRLSLVTEDGEVPVSEVAFLALLRGSA